VIGKLMLDEMPQALAAVKKETKIKGLLFESEKEHFIFGADITEFLQHFKKDQNELIIWLTSINELMNEFEDLAFRTVACINGFALGGGFEVALTADFRIATEGTKMGLPETKLGIMPGWGGSVRLPRLVGADHAIEWITSGNQYKAEAALKIGAVDAVVEKQKRKDAGVSLLKRAASGELDYKKKRREMLAPLKLIRTEATMVFETSKGFVANLSG